MQSLRELFKIGRGPSSSHTMGPYKAATIFNKFNPCADSFRVTLYGSLGATGVGHLTDKVIIEAFAPKKVEIIFSPEVVKEYHPNGLLLEAIINDLPVRNWLVFSVGGGDLKNENEPRNTSGEDIFHQKSMQDIIDYCEKENITLSEYVKKFDVSIDEHLINVWDTMKKAVKKGLFQDGILPGGLNVERRAPSFYSKYLSAPSLEKLVYASSLAVAEENASGNEIVTAPTCGSAGVLPGVLYSMQLIHNYTDQQIIDALCVAGLIGNIVKTNASISGAEVGCQGEVGVACSMAAASIAYLEGGTINQIEYAAEIALEHHLGMTCDPIDGLVQIPCIERNAIAAMQAFNCANYALFSNGIHRVTLDDAIYVMNETGKDLQEKYRETSNGGLAKRRGKND